MRETNFEGGQAEFASAGGGGAVEMDGGLPASVVQHLELTPEHTTHAGAESLGDGLLARESSGELFGTSTAVVLFALGVKAAEKAFAEAVERGLNASDFDSVHAGGEASIGGANSR